MTLIKFIMNTLKAILIQTLLTSAVSGTCTVFVSVTTSEAPLEEDWRAECEKDGLFTLISWSPSTVKNAVSNGLLISGTSQLETNSIVIENEVIQAREDLSGIVNIGQHRALSAFGSKTLLVVRINTLDSFTSEQTGQISDDVFGTRGDLVNAKQQYKACSFDQLELTPFQDEYTVDGVREISIPFNIAQQSKMFLQNEVTKLLGKSNADYVMYCMPPGSNGKWIAYAYINGWLSVYNDKWCSYVSAQMHEIGHNLGLGHSNEAGIEYNDQSGYMGYSYGAKDTPKMCFNAYHSWMLGWYNSKVRDLTSSEPFEGELSPITDYNSTNSVYVLIRVVDYFISYNKKEGFNSGTVEGADQVLVFRSQSVNSDLVAKLGPGTQYTLPDLGNNKTIKVHAIVSSKAFLSVLDLVTQAPTLSPTRSQKKPATNNPTKRATCKPVSNMQMIPRGHSFAT